MPKGLRIGYANQERCYSFFKNLIEIPVNKKPEYCEYPGQSEQINSFTIKRDKFMKTSFDFSNTSDWAVYCGTYAKYNDGSIEGKWLKFSDYSDSEEFFAACAELHSDEHDPEFMFQDTEYLPDSLYSESLSEKDVDNIYEYIEFGEKIEDWGDSEWIAAHNTYCGRQNNGNGIYEFDEEFFQMFFPEPMAAARAVHFGDVNWTHSYCRLDGYGNIESFNDPMDTIDTEALVAEMLENPRNYDL